MVAGQPRHRVVGLTDRQRLERGQLLTVGKAFYCRSSYNKARITKARLFCEKLSVLGGVAFGLTAKPGLREEHTEATQPGLESADCRFPQPTTGGCIIGIRNPVRRLCSFANRNPVAPKKIRMERHQPPESNFTFAGEHPVINWQKDLHLYSLT